MGVMSSLAHRRNSNGYIWMKKKSIGAERSEKRVRADIGSRRLTGTSTPDVEGRFAGRGSKSLMKTSDLGPKGSAPGHPGAGAPHKVEHRRPSAPANAAGRNQKIDERVAAASEELASGISEAAS